MMRKAKSTFHIATFTYHMAQNYGAMLQAYALQKTIEAMGIECEILDYRLPYIDRYGSIHTLKETIVEKGLFAGASRYIWRHLNGWYRDIPSRRKQFDRFMRENMRLSRHFYHQKAMLEKAKYDAVVFGSDQIWNTQLTGGFAGEYVGEQFDSKTTALIAYAASCGRDTFDSEYRDRFVSDLQRFLAVGVREESFSRYLNEKCGIHAHTVLDPVLLADPQIWCSLAEQGQLQVNEPYLLIYSFDAGEDIYNLALHVARERKLKAIAICYQKQAISEEIEQLLTCGPKEFLYLFQHADFVCTTSFHGLAFSILFEKSFYCMAHPSFGQREKDLIKMLGLHDRLLPHFEDLNAVTDCNYFETRKLLSNRRKESIHFLEESLKLARELKGRQNEQR